MSPGHEGENEDKRLIAQLSNSMGITVFLLIFFLCCAGLLFVLYLLKKEERGKKRAGPFSHLFWHAGMSFKADSF